MLPPTTSSRRTWRACSNGAWWPRPPGCGLLCAKLITSPLIQLGWGCRDSPHSEGHPAWKRTVGGALSWLCPGVTRGLRGNPTMIAWARRSWICYSSNRCGRIGQRGTLRPTTFLAWSPSSSTMPRAWSTSPSFGTFGGPGSPHVEDGGTRPWCPSQLTWLRGEHHGPEQFGRYGVGLVPWRLGRNPCHLARLVDCRRLNSVSDASPQCAVPVHPPNVLDVTPSCVETHLQQLRPSDVCLLPGDTEVCSAVSGPARTLQTLAAVVSGVAMAYHPGAYAVQAASEAPPCAETAMERVAATRVEQWRSQWGLQDETDFAYAFASYDSAVAHGGHHVADAWLQARSKSIEADLIPQAAAVAESSGSKDRPATWPTPKASMMKKSKMVQALRVRPGPDQPEHVLLRAEALRKAFSQAKVMRPQGELTPERYSQWQDALDTLAKRKVTEAEGATVVNALKSWAELRAYMEQKDRLFPPDALDLYGFLQNETSGPYRAFHSLKWFSKHGRLQWDFSDVPVPARKNPPKQANPEQAVAVEPPMIAALEERIQSLYEAGDPRWRGLLSSWLVAFGVLRYKHIMRARPVKVTPCSFHGYCPKGKQKANRGGFSFSIPATFINGWAWGSALFRDYSSLGKAKQATSGLCFDAEGTAYTLKFVNELNREVFEHLVQNTEDLSSYSWRRAGPTVGTLMKLTPLELCSLGDWADRSQIPKEATMPMHYSAARYEHSLRTKHIVRLAMEKLLAYESWEAIPTETYNEALEYARQNVDKVLKQESRVIWAAPLTKAEMQARFQLSEALKLKAAAKREEAQAKGGLSEMPASLNGKVLSAFMKNGAPICGAYQTRTCHLEKEACPGRHACAVLRKAGRVCGGGHPACECHDKKFIKVEEMPGEGPGSGSAKAKPTSKSTEERPPEPAVPPRAPEVPTRATAQGTAREEGQSSPSSTSSSIASSGYQFGRRRGWSWGGGPSDSRGTGYSGARPEVRQVGDHPRQDSREPEPYLPEQGRGQAVAEWNPNPEHGASLSKGSYPSDCVHGRSPIIQRRSGAHRCPLEAPVCGPWWFEEQRLRRSMASAAQRHVCRRVGPHPLPVRAPQSRCGRLCFPSTVSSGELGRCSGLCQELQAHTGHSRDDPWRGHEVVGRHDYQDQLPQEPVPRALWLHCNTSI